MEYSWKHYKKYNNLEINIKIKKRKNGEFKTVKKFSHTLKKRYDIPNSPPIFDRRCEISLGLYKDKIKTGNLEDVFHITINFLEDKKPIIISTMSFSRMNRIKTKFPQRLINSLFIDKL